MENKNAAFVQKMKDRVINKSKFKFCPVIDGLCREDCVCWRLGANLETDITQIWVECTHKSIEDVVYRETVKFAREENKYE